MANPPCDYCGRQMQPTSAINCCGCGVPLLHLRSDPVGVLWFGSTFTTNELRRPCGDDLIEVTSFADHQRQFVPRLPQPRGAKK